MMEYLLRDNGMMRTNASWQGGTNESCYSRLICWGEKRQTGQIRVLATRRGVKRKHGVAVHQTTAEDAALALQPCRRLMAVMSLFPPAKPSLRRAHPPITRPTACCIATQPVDSLETHKVTVAPSPAPRAPPGGVAATSFFIWTNRIMDVCGGLITVRDGKPRGKPAGRCCPVFQFVHLERH